MKHVYALCAAALLAACGDEAGGSTDIQATLSFAERSDAEIVRLINAAGGVEMFSAEAAMGDFGDTFEPDPCPQISLAGATATITGGCTRLDGVMLGGGGAVTNPLGWDQIDYDYTDDTLYEYANLTITDGSWTRGFDGFVRRTDTLTTWDADVTVTDNGAALRSDLYYHCTNPQSPRCTVTNSGLELPGVGGARLSGSVSIDRSTNRQTMDFTLTGRDTLTIHVADNCIAWQISGTDRGMSCP